MDFNDRVPPYADDRKCHIPSACGLTGIFNREGKNFSGSSIVESLCCMEERGNGLGSGYAAYGIYPEYKDLWAFHLLYQNEKGKAETEAYLKSRFRIKESGTLRTRQVKSLKFVPLLWRYFVLPDEKFWKEFYPNHTEEDCVVEAVMGINRNVEDAFVVSSGKNMGIFKGVGEPGEIAEFYRLDEYSGYLWTGHNRFPTNTVGWWGGSHPFGLLDWSVVHNGEISSYGINRRYLENLGYYCTLFTDTEVVAYLFDLLHRKQGIPLKMLEKIIAAPFWSKIEAAQPEEKDLLKKLRVVYGPALINGPFAVIIARNGFMLGINDRIKLRPLIAAEKAATLYLASEESAITKIEKNPDRLWMPRAGEMTVGYLNNGKT